MMKDPDTTTEPRAGLKKLQPDLCRLHGNGARFVLCLANKRAVKKAWNKDFPTLDAVVGHASSTNHRIGLIPASLGLCVIDVDQGDPQEVIDVLGKPLAAIPTQRKDGMHLYYRKPDGKVGNSKWQVGSAAGEVRCDAGYVILWDPAGLADAMIGWETQEKVNLAALKPARDPAPAPQSPGSNRDRVSQPRGPARWRVDGALRTLDPTDYDLWIEVGIALHNTYEGKDAGYTIWADWSARSDKWDPSKGREKWQSFKTDPRPEVDRITFGTIARRAKEAGWIPRDAAEASELDVARHFAADRGKDYRYADGLGWHQWQATHWDRTDARGLARQDLIAVIEQYQSDKKPQLRAIRRNGFIGGALALAGDCEPIATPTSAWGRDDQDCLLNVRNGTLDLQSGILRTHNRDDLFTAVTDVAFQDPTDDALRVWDAFLKALFPESLERELGFIPTKVRKVPQDSGYLQF